MKYVTSKKRKQILFSRRTLNLVLTISRRQLAGVPDPVLCSTEFLWRDFHVKETDKQIEE